MPPRKPSTQTTAPLIVATVIIGLINIGITLARQSQSVRQQVLSYQIKPQICTHYVSPDGNNSNSGNTLQTPLKTLQHAVNQLIPGNTLCLRGGIYPESITLSRSGKPELRITITAYQAEVPLIIGSKNASSLITIAADHNTISNLRLEHRSRKIDTPFSWINLEKASQHNWLINNHLEISSYDQQLIRTTGDKYQDRGIDINNSRNHIIENNRIKGLYQGIDIQATPDTHLTIRYNYITDTFSHNLNVHILNATERTHLSIEGNILEHSFTGHGINITTPNVISNANTSNITMQGNTLKNHSQSAINIPNTIKIQNQNNQIFPPAT